MAAKVVFNADTFFDFDKSVLRPDGRKSIDDAVAKLRGVDPSVGPGMQSTGEVIGIHTDPRVALAKVFRRYRPSVVLGIAGKTPLASPDHWQATQITDAAIFHFGTGNHHHVGIQAATDGSKNNKTRIMLCGKPGASKAEVAAMLEAKSSGKGLSTSKPGTRSSPAHAT